MAVTVYLCPLSAILQYFTDAGVVLAGGKVNTYLAGTSTPQATYTDSTGTVANANPLTLNSAGRLQNVNIWQPQGVSLKIVITDASGNPVGPTFDQIAGINDFTASGSALANPANGSGADLVANCLRSFDIFSSAISWTPPALAGGQTLVVCIQGGTSANDGLGGLFMYSPTSSLAQDLINVIKPNVTGNGRLIRLYPGISGQAFTGTLTGMSSTTTGTVSYKIDSRSVVTLQSGAITGTSNSTSMTMTGLPSQITPPTLGVSVPCLLEDNGNGSLSGWATVNTAGVITFGLGANPNFSGFTNSGTKGLPSGWTITYPLS